MEYKGIQYQIVQMANPTAYKWTVVLDGGRKKTGQTATMKIAIVEAQRKIDEELKRIGRAEPPSLV